MKKGFTLLELIVVIIIIGIVATIGFTQYTRIVERGRAAEAVATIGSMRKLAYQYWLEHGDLSTITNADVGVGSSTDQIPGSCRSTHYFWYYVADRNQSYMSCYAYRCSSGGKSPNYTIDNPYIIYLYFHPQGSADNWGCYDPVTKQYPSWCVP